MELLEKIMEKKAKTAVIGLGYVGLPLLYEFAKSGYDALGIDIDKIKICSINRGISYIQDVRSEDLRELVGAGKLKATTDYSRLRDADIISICVPTPLRKSKTPDISYIVGACSKVVKYLRKGQLIILESTTYPGTTEEIVLPILTKQFRNDEYSEICAGNILQETERILSEEKRKSFSTDELAESAQFPVALSEEEAELPLKAGEDFYLAFSPERVDPGNPWFKTKDIPKVIGGQTEKCTFMASSFYGRIFPEVVRVSSTRTAEMVKLLENTFRSVNIALANEMSLMCDSLNVDVWEVIDAAATKPFGFIPFYPGPGLGGHCIPIDPIYLTWKVRRHGFDPKFVELANEFNQKMPGHIVNKVQDRLNEAGKSIRGSKILIIGVAYKRDVSDVRESPSIEIIKLLRKKGADVSYYDPHVPAVNDNDLEMASSGFEPQNLRNSDCVVIATDHSNINYEEISSNCPLIIDTRNALKKYKKR